MNIALKLERDVPVLAIDGELVTRDGLGGRYGFNSHAVLDRALLAVVALLIEERKCGSYPESRDDAYAGWVAAEQLASRLIMHATPRALQDFLAARIARYPWLSQRGEDPETRRSLHELPKDYLVQYCPRRRLLSVDDGSPMPARRDNDNPGRVDGRRRGPYRVGPGRAQIEFDRRAFLLATFGTVAHGFSSPDKPLTHVERLIEEVGPGLIKRGDIALAYALYETYIGFSRTARRAKSDAEDRIQQIELRIGSAEAAIELGRTGAGLRRIGQAKNLFGSERSLDERLRAGRLESLLSGQGGNAHRAHSAMYEFKNELKKHVPRAGWYLTTIAQALSKLKEFKKANDYFDRARDLVLNGSGTQKDDDVLLAIIGSRQAENASKAYAADGASPHRSADWPGIAEVALALRLKHCATLPAAWKVLDYRLTSGVWARFKDYAEASTLATRGLVLAQELDMAHEREQLRKHIAWIEEQRTRARTGPGPVLLRGKGDGAPEPAESTTRPTDSGEEE